MIFIYNLFIYIYAFAVRLASLWNPKAKAWVSGRKDWHHQLRQAIATDDKVLWIHCSSAGEFEQGKPVIEALKHQYSSYKIVLSFFSPSGFTVAKNYPFADVITYLPLDTRANAHKFLHVVHPEIAIFVKYEFWYHHLNAISKAKIPLLLTSAVFRKDQAFFKWYGGFYKKMLFFFNQVFVQDQLSLQILHTIGIHHCQVSGDTRFDRVVEIAQRFTPVPPIEHFINQNKVMIAGSTWPDDEKLLAAAFRNSSIEKMIIAPHEINEDHIKSIESLFPNAVRFSRIRSQLETNGTVKAGSIWTKINADEQLAMLKHLQQAKVLIIDNIGMLSRLYYYATLTFIGGGFTKDGIHNSLEAAVYGKPVIFGPNYKKYREARELIAEGGAFSISTAGDLKKIADDLIKNVDHLQKINKASENYVLQNRGATEKTLQFIYENRLLTN